MGNKSIPENIKASRFYLNEIVANKIKEDRERKNRKTSRIEAAVISYNVAFHFFC